jgi:hypothetical protein
MPRPFSHCCPWLQEVLAQKHGLQNDNQELQDKYNQKAMWVLPACLPACLRRGSRGLPAGSWVLGAAGGWPLCMLLAECPCGCCALLSAAARKRCQPLI